MKRPGVFNYYVFPGSVCLTTTKEQTFYECGKLGFQRKDYDGCWPGEDSKAITSYAKGCGHCIIAIDAVKCKKEKKDRNQIHALLAHEAVHAARALWVSVGEEAPGKEPEAYLIQAISQFLFYEYDKVTKGQRKSK